MRKTQVRDHTSLEYKIVPTAFCADLCARFSSRFLCYLATILSFQLTKVINLTGKQQRSDKTMAVIYSHFKSQFM